jgi:predicted nucleic acid-binding protein
MNKKCLVFDTNALLSLYSYSVDTSQKIINALEQSDFDVVFPAQVGVEFRRHYQKSRSQTGPTNIMNHFSNLLSGSEKIFSRGLASIQADTTHKAFNLDISPEIKDLSDSINRFFKDANYKINLCKDTVDTDYSDEKDPVFSFFERHCTKDVPIVEKIKMAQMAKERFSLSLKPGLTDTGKPLNPEDPFSPYGDVFIWYSILQLGHQYSELVFVENEKKGDWWKDDEVYEVDPFLKQEFESENPNCNLSFFRFESFLSERFCSELPLPAQSEIKQRADDYGKACNKDNLIVLVQDLLSSQENLDFNFLCDESLDDFSIDDFDLDCINFVEIPKETFVSDDASDASNITFECIANYCIHGQAQIYIERDYQEWRDVTFQVAFKIRGNFQVVFGEKITLLPSKFQIEDPFDFEVMESEGPDDELEEEPKEAGNTCPNCGCPLTPENDAGNGFCWECSLKLDK